jgi:hypothetical protein
MALSLVELFPSEFSNPSDIFKNLFEIPVLFYALAQYLFVTEPRRGIQRNSASSD